LRELDAIGGCVSHRVRGVLSLVLLEDWVGRVLVRACRDGSFLLLCRLMLTEGRDRTPTSSESEWPSTERKERWGRIRKKDVSRLVSR
jgi:hypothetical protein